MLHNRHKFLAMGITLILTTGFSSFPLEAAQTKNFFEEKFTGTGEDTYEDAGVMTGKGDFHFTLDTTIENYEHPVYINSVKIPSIKVDATDHKMTLNAQAYSEDYEYADGIYFGAIDRTRSDPPLQLDWKAKETSITVQGIDGKAEGYISGVQVDDKRGTLNMRGMTTIKTIGGTEARGILAKNGTLSFEGLKINNNKTANDYLALKLGENGSTKVSVNVKDNNLYNNLVQIEGNILLEKSSTLNIALTTPESYWHGLSLNANSSPFTLYLKNGALWKHKQPSGSPVVFQGSNIENFIGGTSDNTSGIISQDLEKPINIKNYSGYTTIFYKHNTHQKSIVDPNGYHISGGDIKIQVAKPNSHITLVTDDASLNLGDANLLNGTLNALAHKLYYSGGPHSDKLSVKVGIAEGLTTGSISKNFTLSNAQTIKFGSNNKGEYSYTAHSSTATQKNTAFTALITGGHDKPYVDDHVTTGDGSYKFTKDTVLNAVLDGNLSSVIKIPVASRNDVKILAPSNKLTMQGTDNNIFFVVNEGKNLFTLEAGKLKIEANAPNAQILKAFQDGGKYQIKGDTTINLQGSNNAFVYGLKNTGNLRFDGNVSFIGRGNDVEFFSTENRGTDNKLTVSKDLTLTLKGEGKGQGLVRGLRVDGGNILIKGNLNVIGRDGFDFGIDNIPKSKAIRDIADTVAIYLGSNTFNQDVKSDLDILGNTNITSKGSGIIAKWQNSTVRLGGDVDIEVQKNPDLENYALASIGGKILVNVTENASEISPTDKTVKLTGNLAVLTGNKYKNNGNVSHSRLYVALTNKDSFWRGMLFNDFTAGKDIADARIYLKNSATWYHENQGANAPDVTKIQHFVGGDSKYNEGIIYQNSETPIHFDNYSGNTLIIYKHDTTRRSKDDNNGYFILGGALRVGKVSSGSNSSITLLTDGEGLYLSPSSPPAEKNRVSGTLNALAHKFYVEETHSKIIGNAKVGIAEKLTDPSVTRYITIQGNKYNIPDSYTNPIDMSIDWDGGQGKYNYTPQKENNKPITPAPSTTEQQNTEFSATITGNEDLPYVQDHVEDVAKSKYTFTKNTKIRGTNGNPVVLLKDAKIEAIDKELTLDASATDNAIGINTGDTKATRLNVTTAKTVINATSTNGDGCAYGIFSKTPSTVNMKGMTDIKTIAQKESYGVYATNTGSNTAEFTFEGLKIAGDKQANKTSALRLLGDISAKVNINSSNRPLNHQVVLQGDIYTESKNYQSPTVHVALNTKDSFWHGLSSYTKDTNRQAGNMNLYLQNGAIWQNEKYGKTFEEGFTGSVIQQLIGPRRLENTGFIYQKDENPLTIKRYEGTTTIFYKHDVNNKSKDDQNGYAILGGDIKIENSSGKNKIIMLTDDSGLNLASTTDTEKNLLHGTLNALAGKLYDFSRRKNLDAKVGIAENLTSPSLSTSFKLDGKLYGIPANAKLYKISFKSNGKGEYQYTPINIPTPAKPTKKTILNDSITGDINEDKKYKDENITTKEGEYNLTKDLKISLDGMTGIDYIKKIKINGKNSILTVENKNTKATNMLYGIYLGGKGKIDIDVKKLNVFVDSTKKKSTASIALGAGSMGGTGTGKINIKGDVCLKAKGNNMVFGIYALGDQYVKIEGNLSMQEEGGDTWGIKNSEQRRGKLAHYDTNGIYAGFQGATVEVIGDVDLHVKGTGVQANTNSQVFITGGGNIHIAPDENGDQYALVSEAGTIKFHYEDLRGPLVEKDVSIIGNIGVLNKNTGIAPNIDNATTDIYVGLNTKKSNWTGVAVNQFKEQGKDGGKIYLNLLNGATWTHKKIGKTIDDYKSSYIYKLAGKSSGGIIYQQAPEAIRIGNMSGTHTIVMDHIGKGTKNADYKVGSIYVEKAQKDAKVQLLTFNNGGIDLNNATDVHASLNALAEKIYYSEIAQGKDNLIGTVKIAEDLSHPSVEKEENIIFQKDKQGQGSIKNLVKPNPPKPNPPMPNPPNPNPPKPNPPMPNPPKPNPPMPNPPMPNPPKPNPPMPNPPKPNPPMPNPPKPNPPMPNPPMPNPPKPNPPMPNPPMPNPPMPNPPKPNPPKPNPPMPNPPKPTPPLKYGPTETLMMNGGKNAMALAATMWLSNNNDLARRLGDIRLGKKTGGIFVKFLGGKNLWKPNLTEINHQYKITQVGYDKKINGYVVGLAFDYGTANDNYNISDPKNIRFAKGSGKEKEYSLAFYGSKQFATGDYMDIIMKASGVNSKYTLVDALNRTMSGDYDTKGIALSAEYGKHIDINPHVYLEPSLEFTLGHMNPSDYEAKTTFTQNGKENVTMLIHQDAFNSFRGRFGIGIGTKTAKSTAFLKFFLNREFNGEIHSTFQVAGEEKRHPVRLDFKDTYLDMEFGGSYSFEKDRYAYLNFTKSFTGVLKTIWRFDAGLRFSL